MSNVRAHMQRWPPLAKVLAIWATGTAIVCGAYIWLMRSGPPDELLISETLGFQAIVSLVAVGLPSLLFLFLLLFIGSLAKSWIVGHPAKQLQIAFQPVASSDAEALASLRVDAMRESLQKVGRFDPQRAKDHFLSAFSPDHTRHVLLDGQRVGFFVVRPEPNGLLLDHLYILPSHQGKGLGSAVLAEVFSQADREGLPLRVGALRDSDSNRLYARHGFVLVEQAEFDNYYVRHATNAL